MITINPKWYKASYRRSLVDMHIADWDMQFLSEFSPDEYFSNLQKANITSPMIYLQSHVGHCYFPTETGHMHSALAGQDDLIRHLVDLCHDNGMDVIGYYSLIYNTWAETKHPEWRIRSAEGLSPRQRGGRYGLCCPNNPKYRSFTSAQIREISEYFELEGIFFDMLFWPEFCYCEHCRKRWLEETGLSEMPVTPDWSDEVWRLWVRKHQEWMGEFAAWARDEAKRLMPGITVEHNVACAVAGDWKSCCTELVNESCDYAGGDLYGDLYSHSFAAKYYRNISKNQPFEYMTCRCESDLTQHTVTKSEAALTLEVLLTAAHHGASLIIDAADPVGTLDARVYARIGRAFEKQIPYESHFKGEMIEDVGVYYSPSARFNPDGQDFSNKSDAVSTVRTLVERNIPVGVVSGGCLDRLPGYKFVFAPSICGLTDKERERLLSYVEKGGNLYFSGAFDRKLLEVLLGARFLRMTEHKRTYLAPVGRHNQYLGEFTGKYPMPVDFRLPLIELSDQAEVLATVTLPYTLPGTGDFASIHSDPPGIPTNYPALVSRRYGQGTVIWCAAPVENDMRKGYKDLLMNILTSCVRLDQLSLNAKAPRQVELVSFRTKKNILISAVDLLCTDEMLPISGFTVSVKTDFTPQKVRLLPSGKDIPFDFAVGRTKFTTLPLTMFDMYEIK